ncbi:MAG TPA: hypothetical protein VHI32_01520 [Burkholderiales bacterium]|nr:hypothetical protein [Burkholderiales bacterium]
MSLLWPERLTVALEPLPPEEPQPWQGALEDLARRIAAIAKRVDVTVVLSNHFVRYAVLPERDGAASSEEELALARFHLTKIHGERVKGWEVRVSERLACAIDAELLEGIKDCFSKTKKPRLVSVQPRLMTAYNAARGRIPREGAWLVLAERDRTCLARIATKGWASVHNGREVDVDELLERERSRASGEPLPALVLKL